MDQSYNTNDRRTIDEIASEYIAAEYRTDFIQFTKTGEAKPEFLAYMDQDPRAGEAVDIVFTGKLLLLRILREDYETKQVNSVMTG